LYSALKLIRNGAIVAANQWEEQNACHDQQQNKSNDYKYSRSLPRWASSW
jgi:hypothetical protein